MTTYRLGRGEQRPVVSLRSDYDDVDLGHEEEHQRHHRAQRHAHAHRDYLQATGGPVTWGGGAG